MILNNIQNLIKITEDWAKPHSMVTAYTDDEKDKERNKKKRRPQNVNPMSPQHLYRSPGLNITQHNRIMKKYGVKSNKKELKGDL
jgi:hypothetical protein